MKNKRILVTGGHGFFGKAIVRELKHEGFSDIITVSSAEFDLREKEKIVGMLEKFHPDIVIHVAAKVGGIEMNRLEPATMIYENLVMGIHLMEECRLRNIEKMVNIGTACVYPEFTPCPFSEDHIWNGYPTSVTAAYGIAKRTILAQGQAYREQYGFNSIFLIPTNIYGPGDHFNLDTGHVIPSLVKKIVDAKINKEKKVVIWGTGGATREFIFVDDAAQAVVNAMEMYDAGQPINIGTGIETPIIEIVNLLCEIVNYNGKIIWDETKPDGQQKRNLDVRRAELQFGFRAKIQIVEGLQQTVKWYIEEELRDVEKARLFKLGE